MHLEDEKTGIVYTCIYTIYLHALPVMTIQIGYMLQLLTLSAMLRSNNYQKQIIWFGVTLEGGDSLEGGTKMLKQSW